METPNPEAVARIVAMARATQGAPPATADLWETCAKATMYENPSSNEAELAKACLEKCLRLVGAGTDRDESRDEDVIIPPPIAETAASGLRDDTTESTKKKRKFDTTILPQKLHYGDFVRIPSYLAFVEGMANVKPLKTITKQIFYGNPEDWCPKRNVANSSKPKETPRSASLSQALAMELNDADVSVCHQVPILPDGKAADKQDVDIGIFVHGMQHSTTAHIGVAIKYKPLPGSFEAYESQASAYGTDYMNVSKRSMIVVQVHGGFNTNSDLHIRAFGITPFQRRFIKALLLEGQGENGVQKLVAGLRGFFGSFRCEMAQKWAAKQLSNVTALHLGESSDTPACVVKAYDYRHNSRAEEDRRVPNIDLVRQFVDPDAVLIMPEDSLAVVKTKFYQRDRREATWWFDAVPARGLGAILSQLSELHNMGYVHGDIRLYNMLPHVGRLVDFDFTRREGECYPSTLKNLPWDGMRAYEVKEAIVNGNVATCRMQKSHDIESMLFVLKLYEPKENALPQFKNWWQSNITDFENRGCDLFDLENFLLTTHVDNRVHLKQDPRQEAGVQINELHGKGTRSRGSDQ